MQSQISDGATCAEQLSSAQVGEAHSLLTVCDDLSHFFKPLLLETLAFMAHSEKLSNMSLGALYP